MNAVIIAGGKGTRMGHLSNITPKILLKINGQPLLNYQINLLGSYGFKKVFILVNHLSEKIKEYVATNSLGVPITLIYENEPLGTAGSVKAIEKELIRSDFLVIYGDELINMDLSKMIKYHRHQKNNHPNLVGTLAVHPNDHPFDSDLVEVGQNGLISTFFKKPHEANLLFRNLVSTPIYILTSKVFKYIEKNTLVDFGRQVFPKIVSEKSKLAAYVTPEYIKDIGTAQRLNEANKDVKLGNFASGSLKTPRPAIFLDRDGVLNKEVGNLKNLEDFVLLPGVAKSIKKVNYAHFYTVLITNQPVVAKGFCTLEELLLIHKKMEIELSKGGAKLDGIYFCPHHPDKGFPGENKKYKIHCVCRKPKLGMIRQAVKDLNIDLKKSFMIGDRTVDCQMSVRAGLKFIGVKTGYGLKDKQYSFKFKPLIVKDANYAINKILKNLE